MIVQVEMSALICLGLTFLLVGMIIVMLFMGCLFCVSSELEKRIGKRIDTLKENAKSQSEDCEKTDTNLKL